MNSKSLSTKEKILQTTIELLNKQGISNVTLRDVSETLHISLGNITYYFPKWDNLVGAIFFNYCVKDVERLYQSFPSHISEVPEYVNKIYLLQLKYGFLFSNIYLFFNTYPQYNHIKEEFFLERLQVMRNGFDRMIQQGYFYESAKDHDYDLLTKNIWAFLANWYGFSHMFEGSKYVITQTEFFLSLYNIAASHLTPSGKDIVQQSFNHMSPGLFKN